MENIKILSVIDGQPFDYKTWSGLSYYFFSALKRTGCLYDAISSEPPKTITDLYKLYSFHPDINKWKFKYRISVAYSDERTRTVLRRIGSLNDNKYNAILQVGAWYDLTKIKNKTTVSYHDGNLWTLLKSPFGYPKVHDKYIKRSLEYETNVYKKMDLIFPMSRWAAESFVRDFGVESKKVVPVGAGLNLPYIKEVKDKTYDEPRILFVGKEFERKGGMHLLEAFRTVRKEIKNATLTIIGPILKNLPEGVRCLGYVPKSTKEGMECLLNEYLAASLFVMPSLYEPFGIVFLEAMAHKLPCIGTNICAMPEIIDDGLSGYLVPTRDSKALADRMLCLLKDPGACKKMGENGFDKYMKNFTWDIVASNILKSIKNYG